VHLPPGLPTLPNGWDYALLEELVDQVRGISYGVVQPGNPRADGVPILRVNNVREGRVITDDVLRIAPEIERKHVRTRLQGGEVLLTLVGTLGEVAVAAPALKGWNTARAVGVIPVRSDVGAGWVSLALRSPLSRHFATVWATTTVQATLNLRDVARLPIPMPPPWEREAVYRIFGALDDKIELNRCMNRTLEAMAAALFKAWFVDFEPTGDQTSIDGVFTTIESPSAQRLSVWRDATAGEPPPGWRFGQMSDVAQLGRGTMDPAQFPTEPFDYYSLPAFDLGKVAAVEQGSSIKSNKTTLSEDCVLVSKLNPHIPRVWLVRRRRGVRSVSSTEFLPLTPMAGTNLEFLYCLATSAGFARSLKERATGTTGSHQRVPPDSLLAIPVAIPPRPVMQGFGTLMGPLLAKIAQNRSEAQTLATLRDTLLPKLLSGEIRVRDAESLLGAAV